jgi:hypothetical protein
LSAFIRSGAVSASVPSRSKTRVGAPPGASADAQGGDAARQAVAAGLHRHAAQRRRAERRLEAAGRDVAGEAAQRLLLRHADHRIVVAGHADVGDEAGAAGKNARVGGGDMGVGAGDEADAAVDVIAEGLLLARRLGVEVDDRRVAARAERAEGELLVDALEGVVERVHEHPPQQIDHQRLSAGRGLDHGDAAPRRALGVVGRAQQPRLAVDEDERFALVEGVVAERDRVDAGGEERVADRLGDAEAAGGVLGVGDDQIEPPAVAQRRRVG